MVLAATVSPHAASHHSLQDAMFSPAGHQPSARHLRPARTGSDGEPNVDGGARGLSPLAAHPPVAMAAVEVLLLGGTEQTRTVRSHSSKLTLGQSAPLATSLYTSEPRGWGCPAHAIISRGVKVRGVCMGWG